MGEIRRYRLFLTFLALPAVVVALIVVLLINVFGGSDTEDPGAGSSRVLDVPTPEVIAAGPAGADSPTPLPPTIPEATATPLPPPTPAPTATATATATPAPRDYEIQDGDSLSEIAESNGLTTDELAEFNEIDDPDSIQVGQTITIPSPSGEFTPRPTPAATAAPTPLKGTVVAEGGLNVREEPDIESERAGGLEDGQEVDLTGVTRLVDGDTWYELDEGGWVLGEYLDITDA
jgi:LysM repeat protein